jgi:hypothetical protein
MSHVAIFGNDIDRFLDRTTQMHHPCMSTSTANVEDTQFDESVAISGHDTYSVVKADRKGKELHYEAEITTGMSPSHAHTHPWSRRYRQSLAGMQEAISSEPQQEEDDGSGIL